MRRRGTSRSCLLGSTTSSAASSATSAAWLEASTGAALSTHATTTTRSTATSESSAAAELLRTRAALFNLEFDAVDVVWVGSDGGLVGSGGLEIDESAVLQVMLALSRRSCVSNLP
jgi:hypothetical protein